MCFFLEIVITTILRLGVFYIWEPSIFLLTPKIPLIILPWTLREERYHPRIITLFIADFATSCVAAPIIEELVKLIIVQVCVQLPQNFRRVKRKVCNYKNNQKYRAKLKIRTKNIYLREPIFRNFGEPDISNINIYFTQMIAASLGIKLFDSIRRILMYTKRNNHNMSFYAIFRGIFPTHKLCGTITALQIAKRDILGVDIPLYQFLNGTLQCHGQKCNFYRGIQQGN